MRAALLVSCYVDLINPEADVSMVRVLRKLGVDLIYSEGQTCCAQPAFNSGFFDEARTVARHFLDVFEKESWDCRRTFAFIRDRVVRGLSRGR